MTRRPPRIALLALLALLAATTSVAAGNWATATMDPAPRPAAGIETTFGFEILQHGVTPVSWVTATFVATDLATGEQIQSPMRTGDATGRYIATVTFPQTGEWTWYVMLAELGTDQTGAGGSITVLEPMEAALERLTELGGRLDQPLTLVPAFGRWIEAAGRAAGAG